MYTDKLGVYRIGDLKFHSKLEAIEMHAKTGIHPHWDFNEAAFSCYDWTQEPVADISDLYKQRAIQLREKYDYIILNYSSGADSQTILDTFVDNDILLDEVLSFTNCLGSGNKRDMHNYEIFDFAIPHLQDLHTSGKRMRHRVVDISEPVVNFFKSAKNYVDWIYKSNMLWSPYSVAKTDTFMSITDWSNLVLQGKKVCVLHGTDKPRVVHENGKFAIRFIDIVGFGGQVDSIANKMPYTDEYFYWTPDLPEIIIKQGHLVKNYLNSGDITTLPFIQSEVTNLAFKIQDNKKYWLNSTGLHQLIYPTWARHNRLNAPKPRSMTYDPITRTGGSEKDSWFYDINPLEDFRQNWDAGMLHLWSIVPDYWKINPKNISKGIKGSISKSYFLE